MVIVKAQGTGRPWVGADRTFDLRVDDHPEPLKELRRLVRLQRAYAHANRGDELMTEKKVDAALEESRPPRDWRRKYSSCRSGTP